jgi:hypothetical protein
MEYIYIDSNLRDTNTYPSGSSYIVELPDVKKYIRRVDLVMVNVPNSVTNFDGGVFFVINPKGNISYKYSIEPGFYTAGTLVDALTNASPNGAPITFKASSDNTTMTIACTDQDGLVSFTLTGMGDQALALLNTTNGTADSTFVISGSTSPIAVLDIEEFRTTKSTLTSITSLATNAFAVIPMDVLFGSIKVFKENADYVVSIEYPHVIEKLSRLHINWRDVRGNLLNFNGINGNCILLRIYRTDVPPVLERAPSLPDPEPVPPKPKTRAYLIIGALLCILILIFMRRPVPPPSMVRVDA